MFAIALNVKMSIKNLCFIVTDKTSTTPSLMCPLYFILTVCVCVVCCTILLKNEKACLPVFLKLVFIVPGICESLFLTAERSSTRCRGPGCHPFIMPIAWSQPFLYKETESIHSGDYNLKQTQEKDGGDFCYWLWKRLNTYATKILRIWHCKTSVVCRQVCHAMWCNAPWSVIF